MSLYYGVDGRDLEVFQSGYVHGGYDFQPWTGVKSIRPAEYDVSALMIVYEKYKLIDQEYSATMFTKKLNVRPHIRDEVYGVMHSFLGQ